MPKIRPIVDSLDDVAEPFRKSYKKDDATGKFILSDEVDVEDSEEAKAAARAARRERDEIRTKFKDVDPVRYKELLEEHEDREEKQRNSEKNVEKVNANWQARLDKEVGTATEEAKRWRTIAETNAISAEISTAVSAAKGRHKLLVDHLRQRTKPMEKDGKVEVRVMDADGTERVGKNGEPMKLTEYVESLKGDQDWAHAFEGSGAAGGGAGGGGGADDTKRGAEGWRGKKLKEMSEADKIAASKAMGGQKWREFCLAAAGDKNATPASIGVQ